jgi:hypothetical protein
MRTANALYAGASPHYGCPMKVGPWRKQVVAKNNCAPPFCEAEFEKVPALAIRTEVPTVLSEKLRPAEL